VTAALAGDGVTDEPAWGRWVRHVETEVSGGVVLMDGIDGGPLLVLDRVDAGRVALLMSDHIWLWAREFEGGGPQAELIRRMAHWLMKEPDLEEERLAASVVGGRMTIERRSLKPEAAPVVVTAPSGAERTVALEVQEGGRATATVPVEEPGLYRLADGRATALVAAGSLNPSEFADLRATPTLLAPVAAATGGGIAWIVEGIPELRRTRLGGDTSGRGWMGLRRNGVYAVAGVRQMPLIPALGLLLLVVGGLIAAWYREGR
jgi:hypothetical protein